MFKKALKVTAWVIGILVSLLLLLLIVIHTPAFKNYLAKTVSNYLSEKTHARMQVGSIDYKLPYWIQLNKLAFYEQNGQPILLADVLEAAINPFSLLGSQIEVNKVALINAQADMRRVANDTNYNFQFIIDAFSASTEDNDPEPKPSSSNSKPLILKLEEVILTNVSYNLYDDAAGMHFTSSIDTAHLSADQFNLDNLFMDVDHVYLEGVQYRFYSFEGTLIDTPSLDTSSTSLTINVKQILLKDIAYEMADHAQSFILNTSVDSLVLNKGLFDLMPAIIKADNLYTKGIRVDMAMKTDPNAQETLDVDEALDTSSTPWFIAVQKVDIVESDFKMDNNDYPRLQQQFDANHMDVSRFSLSAQNLSYIDTYTTAELMGFSGLLDRTKPIHDIKTTFVYASQRLLVDDLYAHFNETKLNANLEMLYDSLEDLSVHPNRVRTSILVDPSYVNNADLLYFVPSLQYIDYFNQHKHASNTLQAQLVGQLNALDIKNLKVLTPTGTHLHLNGQLYGLPDADQIRYVINVNELKSTDKDLYLLAGLDKQSFTLPSWVSLTGQITGTMDTYRPNLLLKSALGNARIVGDYYALNDFTNAKYNLAINADALQLDKLLQMEQLGLTTGQFVVTGTGLDVHKMQTAVKGHISQAVFNNYNYQDIGINGTLENALLNYQIDSRDPNARLALLGNYNLNEQDPYLNAQLVVEHLDLHKLHFMESPFTIATEGRVYMSKLDMERPIGDIYFYNTTLATDSTVAKLDTISILAIQTAQQSQYDFNVGPIQGQLFGDFALSDLAGLSQYLFTKHLPQKDTTVIAQADTFGPVNATLNAQLSYHPTFKAFVPELTQLDTISLAALLNNQTAEVTLNTGNIVYGDIRIENANMITEVDESALHVSAQVDSIRVSSFAYPSLLLFANSQNGKADAEVAIKDLRNQDQFALGLSYYVDKGQYALSLHDYLITNYNKWTVNPANKVTVLDSYFIADQVQLRLEDKYIYLQSEDPTVNSPINVDIKQIDLSELAEIAGQDSTFIGGILNVDTRLSYHNGIDSLNGKINIQNLAYELDTFANIDLQFETRSLAQILLDGSISGNENDIKLKGSLNSDNPKGMTADVDIDIHNLALASVEGFTGHQIKNSKGQIIGKLKMSGLLSQPDLSGYLQTKELYTTVTMLNSPMYMPNEKISFEPGKINFDRFSFFDSAKNEAFIDGNIFFRDFTSFNCALRIEADNWQASKAGNKKSDLFHGDFFLSTKLYMYGDLYNPNINGNITILDKTNFTVVLPKSTASHEEREGIVEFVDRKKIDSMRQAMQTKAEEPKQRFSASAINVNIAVEEDAKFNVIIDQSTGDFLSVHGEANLNTSVLPNGNMGIVGSYELKGGAYQFNYNFIKRQFNISSSSKIVFSGDPLDASVNITAVYVSNVAPYDLLSKQLSETDAPYYKQRLPFEVQLKLTGALMSPEINFDIVLPSEKNYQVSSSVVDLVQAKLEELRRNPSELNKQVFSLIILNRFIEENPFANGAGIDAEYIARQSVSRFVSEQLNKLGQSLIEGLEVSLDLVSSEDYTTGTKRNRTDLNASASKRLLDDRLKITVGNNFHLEGAQQTNTGASYLPGNLAANYMITKDGRYQIRLYRRNEELGVENGNVIKTGASFIYDVEYNRFKYLFMSDKKRKAYFQKLRERQAQDSLINATQGTTN